MSEQVVKVEPVDELAVAYKQCAGVPQVSLRSLICTDATVEGKGDYKSRTSGFVNCRSLS